MVEKALPSFFAFINECLFPYGGKIIMIICSLQHVKQMYGAHTVFHDICCEVKKGERVGIIGRNGEGKSTLLHVMAGKEPPSEGTVTRKKGLSLGLLEQLPKLDPEKPVRALLHDVFSDLNELKEKLAEIERALAENPASLDQLLATYGSLQDQFLQLGGYEIDSRINRVVSGLQLVHLLDKKWQELSGGERTKIGLARLLLRSPELLLLDEPTNHLDLSAIEWLTDFIRQYDGTVVIVSHDRYFLDEVTTSIFELEHGELHTYQGNYSSYMKEREERILREFQHYQDQQKKIKKMKETIKRLKEWANRSNPPNDGLHRRAKSMEKALARIELLKKPILQHKKVDLDFHIQNRSGTDVIMMENVAKTYGERELFHDVQLHVRFQERVAIVGENGSGKSTLLNMILGEQQPEKGRIQIGSNVSIGYLSQHNEEMDGKKTILEEFRTKVTVTEGEARHILARYLFYGNTVFRKVKDLSGGERMRLRLAQLVHQRHNLLILDEPTNHLDIDSREVLEEALSEFQGTIIAVCHDRYFLDRLFPVTYWLADRLLTRYEGNYTFAREKRQY